MPRVAKAAILFAALSVGYTTKSADASGPDAALGRLLAGLKKDHGLEFSAIKDNRRSVEIAVPKVKGRTHMVYLFAPPAAIVFGHRYITLFAFSALSKSDKHLESLNRTNASTVLGTWFVGQNRLVTYKIVVPESIAPADFKNLVFLVGATADAKEKALTGKDSY